MHRFADRRTDALEIERREFEVRGAVDRSTILVCFYFIRKRLDQQLLRRLQGSDSTTQLPENVSDAKIALRELKDKGVALYALWTSVGVRIRTVQEKPVPSAPRDGISTLPDAILEMIFEAIHDNMFPGTRRRKEIMRLSHVCRRFRQIVLGLPRLWSDIDSCMHPEAVAMQLTRSKNIALSVDIELGYRPFADVRTFLDLVLPHRSRWSSLMLDFDLAHVGICEEMRQFGTICQGLEFAGLETLNIRFPDPSRTIEEGGVSETYNPLDETLQVYSSWSAPILRTFSTSNVLPRTFNAPLVSLHAQFITSTQYDWDIHPLLASLETSSTLTDLQLTFMVCGLVDDPLPETQLPHLRSLEVVASGVQTEVVASVMEALRPPNLSSLSFEVELQREDDADDWIACFFPEHADYQNLTDLNVVLELVEAVPVLSVPFARLPHLEHLGISAPELALRLFTDEMPCPPLRTLALHYCNKVDNQFISSLANSLRSTGHLQRFETLQIEDCEGLRRRDVEAAFRGKVDWVDSIY